MKILAGAKEQKSILDSAKEIHGTIPGSQMEILPGLGQGQLSLAQPGAYARILEDWITGGTL